MDVTMSSYRSNLERFGGSRTIYRNSSALGLNPTRRLPLPLPSHLILDPRSLRTVASPSSSISPTRIQPQLLQSDVRTRKRRAETSETELVNQINGAEESAPIQRVRQPANEPEPLQRIGILDVNLHSAHVNADRQYHARQDLIQQDLVAQNGAEQNGPEEENRAMRHFRYMLNSIVTFKDTLATMGASFFNLFRSVQEVAEEPYLIDETRQFNTATNHVIVKRLKRQACLPVETTTHPEPETTTDVLSYFEWTKDPCCNITSNLQLEERRRLAEDQSNSEEAKDKIQNLISPFLFHIHCIDTDRIHYDTAVIDEQAAFHLEAGHERDLSVGIRNMMLQSGDEDTPENFVEASKKFRKGAEAAVETMNLLYMNDELIPRLRSLYPKPPRTINLFGKNNHIRSDSVKRAAQFIQWMTHQEVFNIQGEPLTGLCRVLVDVKAVHKNEVPPSFVDFSEKRKPDYPKREKKTTTKPTEQEFPGTFPPDENELDDEENPIEYLNMGNFVVEPAYALKWPSSEKREDTNPPRHYPGHVEMSYSNGRRRGILRKETTTDGPSTPDRRPKKSLRFLSPAGFFKPPVQEPTVPIEDYLGPNPNWGSRPKPAPTRNHFDLDAELRKAEEEEQEEEELKKVMAAEEAKRLAERVVYDQTRRVEVERGLGLYAQDNDIVMEDVEIDPTAKETALWVTSSQQESPAQQEISACARDPILEQASAQQVSSPQGAEEDLYTPEAQLLREEKEAREHQAKLRAIKEQKGQEKRARIEARMDRIRRRAQINLAGQNGLRPGDHHVQRHEHNEDEATPESPQTKGLPSESITKRLHRFFLEDDSDDELGVSLDRENNQDCGFQVVVEDAEELARRKAEEERLRKEQERLRQEAERLAEQRRKEEERRRKQREAQEAREAERRRQVVEYAEKTGLRAPGRQILVPISEEWEAQVHKAQYASSNKEIVKTLEGEYLRRTDFDERLLGETQWLNDNILIGCVLATAAAVNSMSGTKTCAAFTSFFWPRLKSHGPKGVARLMRMAQVKKEAFFELDTILIPICEGSHWTLAVVRPKRRAVAHMDSMKGGGGNPDIVTRVLDWVKESLGEQWLEGEWKEEKYRCPRQMNGYDCGVFTIMNGISMALGVDATAAYRADQLSAMRRQLAATLLNEGFKGDFNLTGI